MTLPAPLVAFRIYSWVSLGETVMVAMWSAYGARIPSLLSELYSSDTTVALETFQLNIEEPPSMMFSGSAVKEFMTGGAIAAADTTTVLSTCADQAALLSWTTK